MDAMDVYAWVFPLAGLALTAALVIGVRSSGRERTKASPAELRLRERTFTGADHVTLEWPRDRRRPTLAGVLRIGEMYGYRLVDRREQEHVTVLEFERVPDEFGV